MKFIYLTVIALLPIFTADIAFASDMNHLHQADTDLISSLYNSSNDSVVVRQGLPERRISGSSR